MCKSKWRLVATVLIFTSVALWYGCDNGVGPTKGTSDYVFYFRDLDTQIFYGYHPETHKVDSLRLPYVTGGLQVSADGRELYVNTANGIEAISVDGHSRRPIWPKAGYVGPSPDGRYVAIQDSGLHILRSDNLSIVFEDTIVVWGGVFSADSRSFYATNYNFVAETSTIYHYKLGRTPSVISHAFNYPTYYMVPSRDQRRWFLYSGMWYEGQDRFLVWDTGATEMALDTVIQPGHGTMTVSPDGRYLFITNPGTAIGYGGEVPSPLTISVFDAFSLQKIKDISTADLFDADSVKHTVRVREVAVSPDSKWLVGLSDASWDFVSVRIDNLTVDHFGRLAHRELTGLTVQNGQ